MHPSTWKVGTSVSSPSPLTENAFTACAEAGIGCVEAHLWGDWLALPGREPNASRCVWVREAAERRGVRVWSAHLPFGREWDISTTDSSERGRTVRGLGRLLKHAGALGAAKAVVHGSFEPVAPEEREARIGACQDSLRRLSDLALELGLQLALECLPRTCLGNTTEEMGRLVRDVDGMGICLDTNHLLQERPEAFIAQLGARITTLHVSDYDGVDERHWLPGRGVNAWNEIIAALEAAGYCGPWMFELGADQGTPVTPAVLRACWDGMLRGFVASRPGWART
jgi:sugar phosphate isomerase/epimerase